MVFCFRSSLLWRSDKQVFKTKCVLAIPKSHLHDEKLRIDHELCVCDRFASFFFSEQEVELLSEWSVFPLLSVFFFFSILHFLFLFDLAHINLFSWGAHTVCWSTRSVLMGVFDCNRPLYLLYCSNKKKKVFWICHCVLLLVNTEPWHTSHSHYFCYYEVSESTTSTTSLSKVNAS